MSRMLQDLPDDAGVCTRRSTPPPPHWLTRRLLTAVEFPETPHASFDCVHSCGSLGSLPCHARLDVSPCTLAVLLSGPSPARASSSASSTRCRPSAKASDIAANDCPAQIRMHPLPRRHQSASPPGHSAFERARIGQPLSLVLPALPALPASLPQTAARHSPPV
ncbi:hypothetical protein K458DRAFT_149679 [Lentithecium fluviatile CBS 122367]|uniref:Uncharacterized protein n=1 Tax=Lentithecium fluviatile CBS 122367 TaxID=1168545 RepID=A0A6G1JDP7_9PLEO|nr:hypothetical protein K458DRAFT_149679 [Lentithecium fluviatile CBS 122367]